MKRKIFFFLVVLLTVLSLASCSFGFNNGNNGGNSGDNGSDAGNKGSLAIIYKDGEISADNLSALESALSGYTVVKSTDINTAADRKLIVGNHGDALSSRAFRRVSRFEIESNSDTAYAIYSDGTSVALVYEGAKYGIAAAENTAISTFISEFTSGGKFANIKKNELKSEVVDIVDYQTAVDSIAIKDAWYTVETGLVKKMGKESAEDAIRALQSLYGIYSDEAATWFANLYDVDLGGFYYSNSARDTEGYLPDIESTYYALYFIKYSGISDHAGNDLKTILPGDMYNDIISWFKGLQDQNGYFYHPQWNRDLLEANATRLDSDLRMATKLLNLLEIKPTYDMPNGIKGDNGQAVEPTGFLTGTLSFDNAVAVSRVISVSDANVPEFIKDKDKFTSYLNGIDIKANSYDNANLIALQLGKIIDRDSQLKADGADYSLVEILKTWLDDNQNANTGLWTEGDKVDFAGINGLAKIAGIYKEINKPIPNVTKALASAIDSIDFQDLENVYIVLNPWESLSLVLNNISTHYSSSEEVLSEVEKLKKTLYKDFVAGVDTAVDSVKGFAEMDGSFSFTLGASKGTVQGMPVGLRNVYEGDATSTVIMMLNMTHYIMESIGYENTVPIYTKADWINYQATLEGLGTIVKQPEINTYDFENSDNILSFVGTREAGKPFFGSMGSSTYLAIDTDEVYGNVVRMTEANRTEVYMDITKPLEGANTIAYEADMKIDFGMKEGARTFGLYFHHSYEYAWRLTLEMSPDSNIVVTPAKEDGKIETGAVSVTTDAKEGEWFNIRVEYSATNYNYTTANSLANDLYVRVYINGKLVSVSYDNFRYDTAKVYPVDEIKMVFWRSDSDKGDNTGISTYFDNILVEQCVKEYPTSCDFDTGLDYPNIVGAQTVVADAERESNVLKFSNESTTAAAELTIKDISTVQKANAIAFEGYVKMNPANGADNTLTTHIGDTAVQTIFTAYDAAHTDVNKGNISLKNTAGASITAVNNMASENQWFKYRIEYINKGSNAIVNVYINDVKVSTGTASAVGISSIAHIKFTLAATASAGKPAVVYFDDVSVLKYVAE